MKKYFLYELKKRSFVIGCITLIAVALYATPILTGEFMRGATESYLWVISTIGGILAAFVPVWLLSYKMKMRSVDLYYSLPLSRVKILTVRFLIGLIAVFVPYTAAYWLGAFIGMARAFSDMNAVFYLPQYFASLIPVYIVYAIASFVYTRANSVIDGLIFMAFWAFAFELLALVFKMITSQNLISWYDDNYGVVYRIFDYIMPSRFTPFAPLDLVTYHFSMHLAEYLNIHAAPPSTVEVVNTAIGFTLTSLTAIGATAGLFLSEGRTKAENAGQISESPFGYKTMIPFYTVCLSGVCSSYILFVIIIAAAFFLTVAYKRTFKIGKIQAIILPASAVAGIILGVIVQLV